MRSASANRAVLEKRNAGSPILARKIGRKGGWLLGHERKSRPLLPAPAAGSYLRIATLPVADVAPKTAVSLRIRTGPACDFPARE